MIGRTEACTELGPRCYIPALRSTFGVSCATRIADPVTTLAEPLALVNLPALMLRATGSASPPIGLIDGPIAIDHPGLAAARIRDVAGGPTTCARPPSDACAHGTFIAGMLVASRGSAAPAICPGCTLLSYPIFADAPAGGDPVATAAGVARAISGCVAAGARILNISATTSRPSTRIERVLIDALDHGPCRRARRPRRRGVGNQGTLGSWAITRHPSVCPSRSATHAAGRQATRTSATRSAGADCARPAPRSRACKPAAGHASAAERASRRRSAQQHAE